MRQPGGAVQRLLRWTELACDVTSCMPNVEVSGLPEAGPLERRVGLVNVAALQESERRLRWTTPAVAQAAWLLLRGRLGARGWLRTTRDVDVGSDSWTADRNAGSAARRQLNAKLILYSRPGPNVELSGLPEAGPLERRVGLVNVAAT